MNKKQLLTLLIDSVTARGMGYLQNEIGLEIIEVEHTLQDLKCLTLRDMTSLVGIGGALGMYVAFSFDKSVIRQIYEIYTADLEVEPELENDYIEETAGDVVNIIIGNAMAELPDSVPAITLTPPVVISEAKSISRHKEAYFCMSRMTSSKGIISIMYIGPRNLFDENLNYKR